MLDVSTNHVLDWLLAKKVKVIRINKNDLKIESFDNKTNETTFTYKNSRTITSSQIKSFWHRRGYVGLEIDSNLLSQDAELQNQIHYHMYGEWEELIRFLTSNLKCQKEVKTIGFYSLKDKKLDQLYKAQKCKLKVPKTLITTSKQELLNFFHKSNIGIITKGISSSPSFSFRNLSLEGYTEEVSEQFINNLSKSFFPSFFQENIKKQYELRIFFLKKSFYAMAIFSQDNEQTKIDLRKYDDLKPNKTVPYILPEIVKKKLSQLMEDLELDTGSIDMIVDDNDEFYFLEVNPNGQFGMVSTPCNYYIEKDIAEVL